MTFTLKTDEVLEALQTAGHPNAGNFLWAVETLCQTMGNALAESQGIIAGRATFEGVAFCGTAVTFQPAYKGQPLPECMEDYDTPSEWTFSYEDAPDPTEEQAASIAAAKECATCRDSVETRAAPCDECGAMDGESEA
jgi:hypothetical protein